MAGWAALSIAFWVNPATPSHAEGVSLEYAVKANFLSKFGPFVEWPPKVFVSPDAPFVICVSGRDPFGLALDQAVRGQLVDGHPIAVRRLQTVPARPQCHVLYVGKPTDQESADILRLVRSAPILTVTDEGAGTDGGLVHFVVRQGRVRFGIDADDARRSGLTISSKLLGLAVPVRRTGG